MYLMSKFCFFPVSKWPWGSHSLLLPGLDFMAVFNEISGVNKLLAGVQEFICDQCAHLT